MPDEPRSHLTIRVYRVDPSGEQTTVRPWRMLAGPKPPRWWDSLAYPKCRCPRCTEVERMSADNSKHTIHAAQGRQERDSAELGAEGEKQQQAYVSQNLHEKAASEDRPAGEASWPQ